MHLQRALLPSLLLLALALPAAAQTAQSLRDDYDRLQHWRFRTDPVAVPAGGVTWTVEGATWRFESGRFWLQEPTSGGVVTGLVFEGKGRFQMAVPDAAELAQLRRFAKRPDLAAVDEALRALVLRTSRRHADRSVPGVRPPRGFAVNKLARDRHEQWLTQRIYDADARVVEALATPGDRYLRADMKTDDFGWLAFDYDAQRIEEVRLEAFNTSHPAVEVWVSLDRPGRARRAGAPDQPLESGGRRRALRHRRRPHRVRPRQGLDEGEVQGRRPLPAAARRRAGRAALTCDNFAKVTSVSEGGKPLPFLRDHIGDRRASLDGRLYDASLIVLLDQPLAKGVERRIDLEYELDVLNFAPGRDWYPSTEGDETVLRDEHTARLELKTRKKFEVRANGRREESGGGERTAGRSTTVWIVDHPIKMLTFTYADYLHEERVTHDGVPDVICFGSKVPLAGGGRFREVGQDVIDSLAFYQKLFDAKLPDEPIYVSSINAGHGQAFDGFIQLAHRSFDLLGPGIGELFRAHEAAHQFWGVMVGSATYRDAWLGEAFAEYSGMMFVEQTMKDGPQFMDEIIHAYNDEQNGSIKSGFSKFTRMDVNKANLLHGDRTGPIGHGWRADTGEVPTAYGSQVYGKGALVLHMLRGMLRDQTGSDQAFLDVLRDFLHTYRGQAPSTGDFEAVLARHVPGDWSWFFDEWVNGMAIPTYRWSYEVAASPDRREKVRGDSQGPPERCSGGLQDVRAGRGRIRGRPHRAPPGDGGSARAELPAGLRRAAEEPDVQRGLRGAVEDEAGVKKSMIGTLVACDARA